MWPMAEVSSVRISSALFPASLASIMACMHSGVSGRNGPIPFPTKLRSLGARDEGREGDGEVCALDVKNEEERAQRRMEERGGIRKRQVEERQGDRKKEWQTERRRGRKGV